MTDPYPDIEEETEGSAEGLRTFRLIAILAIALVAGIALLAWLGGGGHRDQQPAGYPDALGGPFELTAPDGSTVTDKTLAGKPFAIFFGFTRCPDVCPTTLSRLAQLRKRMGADGDRFAIVFVSVDPGHDTPQDVGRYVGLFGTPIIGLTGTAGQLAQIVKAYRVYYRKVPVEGGDYTIDHTAGVYLMDRAGKLQSVIEYDEGADVSLAKLKRLAGR
ncbi:MAG: SCO family protein [Novosphingobium sp.]|nr:SCO family protein [Novosphingobium sp.]